jgi:DnaJ like chaperone protein
MNAVELVVAVLGVLVGYWVVSLFLKPKAAPPVRSPSQPAPAAPAWNEVLGVSSDATSDQIQAAYRSLMSQYHPDKVASLGVELQTLAESKSKQIGAAYREGMSLHGIDA